MSEPVQLEVKGTAVEEAMEVADQVVLEETADQVVTDRGLPHKSSRPVESLFVGILCFLFLCMSSYNLGVWESWESMHARLIEWMWSHETWLQVHAPTGVDQARAVGELSMGWWPSMISVYVFHSSSWMSSELSLRLPSLLLAAINLMALYSLMREWKGRLSAVLSIALLLITPAFSLMSRHGLNAGGVGALACSGAALCYWRAGIDLRSSAWRALGSLLLILSAGSLGIMGLLLPLIAWFSVNDSRQTLKERVYQSCCYLAPVLIVLAIYAWRSWIKKPDNIGAWQLFVTIDPLTQVYDYSEWNGFQRALHLIGFGLFPIGALLPVLAFILRRADESPIESRERGSSLIEHRYGASLLSFFVLAFFSFALLSPSGGYWGGAALILSPPIAIAGALFLGEWRSSHHPPILYVLCVIFFWLLIDGDLKREPTLLIGAITGDKAEGLLSDFSSGVSLWRFVRYLTLMGVIILISFQTKAMSRVWGWFRELFSAPPTPRHHPVIMGIAILAALAATIPHLTRIIPRWVVGNSFVNAPFWSGVTPSLRVGCLMIIVAALSYYSLWVLWRVGVERDKSRWWRRLDVELAFCLSWLVITPHYLTRLPIWIFMRPLTPLMESTQTHQPNYLWVVVIHLTVIIGLSTLLIISRWLYSSAENSLFAEKIRRVTMRFLAALLTPKGLQWRQGVIIGSWVAGCLFFTQLSLPRGLSAQLSHQGVIRGYQEKMSEGEELNLYLVKEAEQSYYLNEIDKLKRTQFEERATADKRQFFIIGRDQLSRANGEFRVKTGEHLPILDDRHHELLLATNQLLEGERDLNPIKNAVIDELPENVQTLKEPINFENKIKLIAWRLTPAQPRPGAPVKIDLFWKAERRVRSHWKVFIHIDAPGQRIHADHEPVLGVYPTEDWRKDDLIIDTHHITVKRSIKPASFTFFAGLYRGKKRMKIMNTDKKIKGKDNRAILGKVSVR